MNGAIARVQLVFEDDCKSQCEICERIRPDMGAVLIQKTPHGHTLPLTDFVICAVCVRKILLIAERHRLQMDRAPPRSPPEEESSGGGQP